MSVSVTESKRLTQLRSADAIVAGSVTATSFTGSLSGNATTVTTIPELTGHITSTGNVTSLGSFTTAQLLAAVDGATGTGAAVFGTGPTLTTPALGAATATSINKLTITVPASPAILTLVGGSSLITAGAYSTTLTSTAATNVTLPTTGILATRAGAETLENKTLTAPNLGTPTTLVGTNITGTATNFTASTVTTNAILTGDVTSVGNAATVVKINGTSLSGLATGILKNTTTTGVPSIAVAADFPILNQNTLGNAATATKIATITNTDIVQLGAIQTLTFKTLFRPTIQGYARFEGGTSGTTTLQATAVAGNTTLTLPAVTGTLATRAGAETLENKTLESPVINSPTGLVKGDVGLGNVTNESKATMFTSPTFTGTVTIPTGGSIIAPTGLVKGDVGLGNVDNTSNATERAAAATLTNKTLTTPIISSISNTGTLTLPTSTDTLVGRATTDTLTNKTLRRTVVSATGSFSLEASDAGKVILLTTSGLDVTIPADEFIAGDEFTIINDSQIPTIGACTITADTGVKTFIVATQYNVGGNAGASFSLGSRRGVKFICTTGGASPRFYGWRS
jgi:hypothetical protein